MDEIKKQKITNAVNSVIESGVPVCGFNGFTQDVSIGFSAGFAIVTVSVYNIDKSETYKFICDDILDEEDAVDECSNIKSAVSKFTKFVTDDGIESSIAYKKAIDMYDVLSPEEQDIFPIDELDKCIKHKKIEIPEKKNLERYEWEEEIRGAIESSLQNGAFIQELPGIMLTVDIKMPETTCNDLSVLEACMLVKLHDVHNQKTFVFEFSEIECDGDAYGECSDAKAIIAKFISLVNENNMSYEDAYAFLLDDDYDYCEPCLYDSEPIFYDEEYGADEDDWDCMDDDEFLNRLIILDEMDDMDHISFDEYCDRVNDIMKKDKKGDK